MLHVGTLRITIVQTSTFACLQKSADDGSVHARAAVSRRDNQLSVSEERIEADQSESNQALKGGKGANGSDSSSDSDESGDQVAGKKMVASATPTGNPLQVLFFDLLAGATFSDRFLFSSRNGTSICRCQAIQKARPNSSESNMAHPHASLRSQSREAMTR